MTTKKLTLICAALLAASCSTKNENAFLVITKLVAPTAVTSGTTTTCTFSPASDETVFATVNASAPPTSTKGFRLAAVVENRLTPNTNTTLGRLNSYDFVAEQVVVSYEAAGSAAVSIKPQIIPAGGVVKAGGSSAIGIDFFTPGTTGVPGPGTTLRLVFHLEGKLLDGSTVKSSEYEYLVTTCGTATCDITSACP